MQFLVKVYEASAERLLKRIAAELMGFMPAEVAMAPSNSSRVQGQQLLYCIDCQQGHTVWRKIFGESTAHIMRKSAERGYEVV